VRVVDELDNDLPPGTVRKLVVRTAQPWNISTGYDGRSRPPWRLGATLLHTIDAFRVDHAGNYSSSSA
jgi:hypothetical protein